MNVKKVINESEMECLLISKGINIFDKEKCIDSIKVIENALALGYKSNFDEDTQTITFTK